MERIREYCHVHCETALAPLARLLLRLHVSPNQVTVAGVLLNFLAAGLIVADQPILAGVVYLVAGVLDLLDGVLARLAKMATPFGAFLDSTLDRFSEGILFAAIAYRFAFEGAAVDAGLTVLALLGSLLVSYARARAAGLGVECKGGLVTRAERVIVLAAGLLSGMLPYVVYLLVLATGFTVIQRIVSTFRQVAAPGGDGETGDRPAVSWGGTEGSSSD